MPDWVIKIKKNGCGDTFDPASLQSLQGDTITWANEDSEEHQPIRTDGLGPPLVNTPIAPGGSSDGYNVPDLPAGKTGMTIAYQCAFHSNEKGAIEVLSAPPTFPNPENS